MGSTVVLDLVGGVALLLWGLHMVHSGVVRAFGAELRRLLGIALQNRFRAFLAGVFVTAVLQSSTATGLMVAYGYLMEVLLGWYNGNKYEVGMLFSRFKGPYWPAYWMLILCNILIPQLLWWKRFRLNLKLLWCITIVINIGMWLERFVIVVISLHRDFLPSSWGIYHPTIWDVTLFFGTMGFFMTLICLFVRLIPAISIFETRHLLHELHDENHHE